METKSHIEYLREKQRYSEASLQFGQADANTIWISTLDCNRAEHSEIEAELIKRGCWYSSGLAIGEFNSKTCRTVTVLKEPLL